MVEQKIACGAEVLLDVPPALCPLLPQAFEAGHKLATGIDALKRSTAPVDILLAFRLVLAPFQRRVVLFDLAPDGGLSNFCSLHAF